MIDEVELACCVDSCTGDGEEAVFQLTHSRSGSENGRRIRRRWRGRIGWNIQDSELALAYFEMMRNIFNRVFVGEFAQTQEGAATVVVADSVTAFGIHVNVAEVNVG